MAQLRRNAFLIDRPFQLRFSFYVCSWLFALSIVYPLIIYSLFNYFLRYLSLDPNGPSLVGLQDVKGQIVWLLVVFQLVFLVVTFLISIFVSHRIAGPLYKLRRFFNEAKAGQMGQTLRFRKKDHFQNVAAEYNEMMVEIRAKFDGSRQALNGAIELLEKAGKSADNDKILSGLKQARDKIPH
jgi:sensor histidine kinase YesM